MHQGHKKNLNLKPNYKCFNFNFFKYSIFSFDPSTLKKKKKKEKSFQLFQCQCTCYLLPQYTSLYFPVLVVYLRGSEEGNDSATYSVPNHGPYLLVQSHPKEEHWRAAALMKKQRICIPGGWKCAKKQYYKFYVR